MLITSKAKAPFMAKNRINYQTESGIFYMVNKKKIKKKTLKDKNNENKIILKEI